MKNYLKYINEYASVDYDKDYTHKSKSHNYAANMKILDINEAVDYCIKNCKEFLNNPKHISRSITASQSYFYSKPIKRHSRDNANHYTLILDNSPHWKGYPKRSKSFICVGGLGGTYLVIPKDNSKWGICSNHDIYFSFINSDIISINRFFVELYYLAKYLFDMVISDKDYELMKQDINLFQEKLYKMTFQDVQTAIDEQYMFYMEKNKSFLSFLEKNWGKNLFDAIIETMTPVVNNFKLKSYKDLNKDLIKGYYYKEMWTDSTCLFIKQGLYMENFFELLMYKTGKDFSNFYNL